MGYGDVYHVEGYDKLYMTKQASETYRGVDWPKDAHGVFHCPNFGFVCFLDLSVSGGRTHVLGYQ